MAAIFDFINTTARRRAIDKGADFDRVLTWKEDGTAVDLTGYSAKMQIRDSDDSLVMELSTDNGRITVDSSGTITLHVPGSDTALIPETTNEYYRYDLLLTSPTGVRTRLIEGRVEVTRDVTRE